MAKTLSRGIACQYQQKDTDGNFAFRCGDYAHEEWVDDLDQPIGSGTMLCHFHSDIERAEIGLRPRGPNAPCVECGTSKVTDA